MTPRRNSRWGCAWPTTWPPPSRTWPRVGGTTAAGRFASRCPGRRSLAPPIAGSRLARAACWRWRPRSSRRHPHRLRRNSGARGGDPTTARADLRGFAFGLLAAIQRVGNLAASVIAGVLWTATSPMVAFVFIAGAIAFAVLFDGDVVPRPTRIGFTDVPHPMLRTCGDHGSSETLRIPARPGCTVCPVAVRLIWVDLLACSSLSPSCSYHSHSAVCWSAWAGLRNIWCRPRR